MEIYNTVKPKEKLPCGRPNKFTSEYMRMVASKIVDEGMTWREASETFNCSTGAIAKWIRDYKKGIFGLMSNKVKEQTKDHKIHTLESSIKDLKKEIGELYLENLMLKKVLSHSQRTKKENSSVITSENLAQFQKDAE